MAEAGAPRKSIRDTVRKKDGKKASLRCIQKILAHAQEDVAWQGENSRAGGRPQELPPRRSSQAEEADAGRGRYGEGDHGVLQETCKARERSNQTHKGDPASTLTLRGGRRGGVHGDGAVVKFAVGRM